MRLLPKIVACEGPLIILTGAQDKGGSPLIRACPVIRSDMVLGRCTCFVLAIMLLVILYNSLEQLAAEILLKFC